MFCSDENKKSILGHLYPQIVCVWQRGPQHRNIFILFFWSDVPPTHFNTLTGLSNIHRPIKITFIFNPSTSLWTIWEQFSVKFSSEKKVNQTGDILSKMLLSIEEQKNVLFRRW